MCQLPTSKGSLLKIFTAHGWAFAEKRPSLQIKLIKIFSRFTCLFYHKIICVSEFDRQLALQNKITSEKKLLTIHNGIQIADYNFLPKERARQFISTQLNRRPPSELWIGTVGEFTKNKGQKYLIEAIKKLKENKYSLTVVIVGWGEDKTKLQNQITKLNLQKTVFLIDNLTPAAPYLKAFDIFVLPSLKEGLPYTLLEAGLARLPVVATRAGGIPEIIEHDKTGLLVRPKNSMELAEALEKFIENQELRNLSSFELWSNVSWQFNFQKMLKATLTTYQKDS
jgi:glycosyltransferase involved in cell wall biosynthesis